MKKVEIKIYSLNQLINLRKYQAANNLEFTYSFGYAVGVVSDKHIEELKQKLEIKNDRQIDVICEIN